jgi:hypothetical protein
MGFHMQASFSSSQHAGCRIHVMKSTQHTRSLFDKTDTACSVLGLCYGHAARTSCIALIKRVMCTSAVPASCTRHAACCCWGATCPARDCSEAEACARWHTCPHAATLDLCLPIMASHCLTSHSAWQTCSCVPDQQARLHPSSSQREGGPHFRHAHVLWPFRSHTSAPAHRPPLQQHSSAQGTLRSMVCRSTLSPFVQQSTVHAQLRRSN